MMNVQIIFKVKHFQKVVTFAVVIFNSQKSIYKLSQFTRLYTNEGGFNHVLYGNIKVQIGLIELTLWS